MLYSILIAVGLKLGPKSGLGAPVLEGWLTDKIVSTTQKAIGIVILTGLGAGLLMILLDVYVFAPQLETHKLKGKFSGLWACSVGYNLRIVFDFVKSKELEEDDILLLGMGTHDEVY